jgi:hypothetical protein
MYYDKLDNECIVKIIDSPRSFGYDIGIIRKENGKLFIANIDKDGFLEFHEVQRGEIMIPTFTLDDDIILKLIEAYTNIGRKIPDHSKIEGKLEATEKHLEDMRIIATKCIDRIIKIK